MNSIQWWHIYFWNFVGDLKAFFIFISMTIVGAILMIVMVHLKYTKSARKLTYILIVPALFALILPSKPVLALMMGIEPLTHLIDNNQTQKVSKVLDNYTDILYLESEKKKKELQNEVKFK